MDHEAQRAEVDRNYDVFMRMLASLLPDHRNEWALMRDGQIVGLFAKPGKANCAGVKRYPDAIFSIQEITDEPIDLGFWSHVASH